MYLQGLWKNDVNVLKVNFTFRKRNLAYLIPDKFSKRHFYKQKQELLLVYALTPR